MNMGSRPLTVTTYYPFPHCLSPNRFGPTSLVLWVMWGFVLLPQNFMGTGFFQPSYLPPVTLFTASVGGGLHFCIGRIVDSLGYFVLWFVRAGHDHRGCRHCLAFAR